MEDIRLRQVLVKLEASQIQATLIKAGLYLTGFELLRYDVVNRTKDFFLVGFQEKGFTHSPEYDQKVRTLDSDIFVASAKWLVTVGAVTADQAEELAEIRRHRNEIAHELPKLLVDPSFHLSPALLERCRYFVDLLGRFWGSIEADTSPDFAEGEIDYEGIKSGSALLMDLIWDAAHGPAA